MFLFIKTCILFKCNFERINIFYSRYFTALMQLKDLRKLKSLEEAKEIKTSESENKVKILYLII